ncbi:shikimate kinase [Oscillospiraceae bacterium CM]|nr:shikimate kinase [Oscillospiraceae bacterium CM]
MKQYGLLGEKLTHSFSPLIHASLGDYAYKLYEVAPENVAAFLNQGDFDGLNVTIPYKKTVIPFLSGLTDKAKAIGSVNTITRRPDGALVGDNTDYDGFLYLLKKVVKTAAGKKTLVLGSGGSSLAVRAVLTDDKAAAVVTVSRGGADNYDNLSGHADAALLVNTTPVGMYPYNGASPVDLGLLPNLEAVIDIIYNPAKTSLMLDAAARGMPCIGGLPMLVAQAKRAAELFTGRPIDDGVIDEITENIAGTTRNIVLIGMPGSGKSTTGKALARAINRPFVDTDELIATRAGKSIPAIFSQLGESSFRRLETDILRDVSKESGTVIATGGGIVKSPENLQLIQQNSVCVFLDRALTDLPVSGRPLSQQLGVSALAEERLPLYSSWCDHRITVTSVDETVASIRAATGI